MKSLLSRSVCSFTCVLLSVVVRADSPGLGSDALFRAVISGDFVVAGSSIASARTSTLEPGAPVLLSLTIPQSASVVAAFTNWTYLTRAPQDGVLRSIVINGTPVPDNNVTLVQSTTDDICWLTQEPPVGVTATYFADVTEIVAAGFGQQTQATFTFTQIIENDLEQVGPLGEGVSLLVVYSDPSLPLRLINVYAGLIQTDDDTNEATAMLQFFDDSPTPQPARYLSGAVHLFMNALDGQLDDDDFFFVNERQNQFLANAINDNPCGGGVGVVWCGRLGPTLEAGRYWYDHGETHDLESLDPNPNTQIMDQGDRSVGFRTVRTGDCIGHSFAAISFDFVPCTPLYVDTDAPPNGDGQSWNTAYRFLQDALANVDPTNCSTGTVSILVAEGTYRRDEDEANPNGTGDRQARFQLLDSVNILGGFAGFGTADPDVRNITLYETILSGDLNGNDITNLAGGMKCFTGEDCDFFGCVLLAGCESFDTNNDNLVSASELHIGDNSEFVVSGDDNNETAVLDGFIITAGNGGGMLISSGEPTVRNCKFDTNLNPLLQGIGGGVILTSFGGLTPSFTNCVFTNNVALFAGGGMAISGSNAVLTNCTFVANQVHDPTEVFDAEGAGIAVLNDGAPLVRNSIFWGNSGSTSNIEANQILVFSGTTDVDFSDWQGHAPEGNNIEEDPLFLGMPDNLRLQKDSLVRNVGDDSAFPTSLTTDLDGGPRFDGVIDMGAYEWSDCNGNNIDDGQDIYVGTSLDANGSGIPDECLVTPLGAVPPHNIKKNRYISFDPTMHDFPIAFKVTMIQSLFHPDALGFTRWVGMPDAKGVAGLEEAEAAPVVRYWPETVIHVMGCAISPKATYEVRASDDLGLTFTLPLPIDTIERPRSFKWWGDTVGFFDGQVWSPPNLVVNADDFLAAIKTFQDPNAVNATHVSVTDVEGPKDLEGQGPNRIVNINDVFMIVKAFQGDPYPNGCPDDPCWDLREISEGGQGPCPGVPPGGGESAPLGPATVSTLSLLPSADLILQGELIGVEVFLDVADDLGGYQLDVEVSGGSTGSLDLEDLFIDDTRFDYVFFGVNSLESVSPFWGQVGAVKLDGAGIPVTGPAYLGTFQFRASAGAVGVFSIRFADIENNFLMNGDARRMTDAIADDEAFIGVEVECAIDSHCDDGNACTDDACNNGTCVYTNDDTNTCSDGNDCTDDACSSGTCVSANDDTNTCTDGNDCTADSCLSGVCTSTNEPVNTACDDGFFCTKTDKCDGAGVCVGTGDPCRGKNPYCCEYLSTCGPFPCS